MFLVWFRIDSPGLRDYDGCLNRGDDHLGPWIWDCKSVLCKAVPMHKIDLLSDWLAEAGRFPKAPAGDQGG